MPHDEYHLYKVALCHLLDPCWCPAHVVFMLRTIGAEY